MEKEIERCACGWRCNSNCMRYGERVKCLAFFIEKKRIDKKDKKKPRREGGDREERRDGRGRSSNE